MKRAYTLVTLAALAAMVSCVREEEQSAVAGPETGKAPVTEPDETVRTVTEGLTFTAAGTDSGILVEDIPVGSSVKVYDFEFEEEIAWHRRRNIWILSSTSFRSRADLPETEKKMWQNGWRRTE